MSAQTWKVVATPRERCALAMLLLHRDLKFKTREPERRLNRARRALGLIPPTEAFLEHKGRRSPYCDDRSTRHRFEVTHENAEFLLEQLGKVEKNSVDALVLEPLLEQLEARRDTPGAEEAPAYDEGAEAPRWKPSSLPIVEEPEHLIDVLVQVLAEGGRTEPALDHLHSLLVRALRPPPEPEAAQPNGHVPDGPEPALA